MKALPLQSQRLRMVEPAPTEPIVAARAAGPPRIDEVFRDHVNYVAAIALRLLNNEDDADDVIQDVFVIATEGLHRLRDAGALRGWLGSITARLALRRLRRRRFLQFFSVGDADELDAVASRAPDPETYLLLREIYGVLEELPAALRVAWILRYVEGEAIEQVAALCDCSLSTAKRRIAEAQSRVRMLSRHG